MNKLKLKSLILSLMVSLVAIVLTSAFYLKNDNSNSLNIQVETCMQSTDLGDIISSTDEIVSSEEQANVLITEDIRGRVEGSGKFAVGSGATIKAIAKVGCEFKYWQVYDSEQGQYVDWIDSNGELIKESEYSFIVEEDITLRAYFDYKGYTVNKDDEFYDYYVDSVDYVYDSERFSEDENAEYPLAIIKGDDYKRPTPEQYGHWNFYYNDIATISYTVKEGTTIKQLSANDFSLTKGTEKDIVVLHINNEGKLIGEEKDGVFTVKSEDFVISNYQNNVKVENNCYYIILTQEYVGGGEAPEYAISSYEKYLTTNITLICKITEDLEFEYNVEKLNTVTIRAYEWFSNEEEFAIDISNVADLIEFEYGYFSRLGYKTIDGVECLQFTVQENSNYKFNFSSNKYFSFIRSYTTQHSSSESLSGYFYPYLVEDDDFRISVSFERVKYNLTFKEYFLNDARFSDLSQVELEELTQADFTELSVDEYIYNIQGLRLYPSEEITLDLNEEGGISLTLPERFTTAYSLTKANIYGYNLKAVVIDFNNIDLDELTLNTGIDNSSPTDVEVKIVYEKILYTLKVEVVNNQILENGEVAGETVDSYFASKLTFSGSFISGESVNVVRNDSINLTADINSGFEVKGWRLKNEENNLTETSFNFIPTSNDSFELTYQIIVDYIYYDTTFNLDGIISSSMDNGDGTKNTFRANMDIVVVEYLTSDGSTLTVVGNKYYINSTEDLADKETEILTEKVKFSVDLTSAIIINQNGNVGLKKYSTSIGDIYINFNGENFEKITINNVVFEYNNETLRYETIKTIRNDIVINGEKTANEITDVEIDTSVYKYTLNNVTSDDLILMRSQSADTSKFKLRYYLYDNTTTESYNIHYFKEDDSDEGSYYSYIYKTAHGDEITVVYIDLAQNITIEINNSNAFDLKKLEISISGNGASTETTDNGSSITITANPGMGIKLSFNKNDIVKGYKFNSFSLKPYAGTSETMTKVEEGNIIYVEFSMVIDYYNAVIMLDFSAINYTVNINYQTHGSGGEIIYNIGGVESSYSETKRSFEINIESVLDILYEIKISSSVGYYISNVYVGSNPEVNVIDSLIGDYSQQTELSFIFDRENFTKYVLNLADENNVTINIIESERLYDITVIYNLIDDEDLSYYASSAITELSQKKSEVYNVVFSSSAKNGNVTFTKIEYGSELKLTINDSEVPGLYFKGWNEKNGEQKEIVFTLQDNITVDAYFKLIEYTINFKLITSETGEEDSSRGSVDYGIQGVKTSSMKIYDKVEYTVSANTGYRYDMCYYLQGDVKQTNNIDFIDKVNHKYELTFDPTSMPGYSKQSQLREDTDNYRTLIIYFEFSVKVYQINCETTGSKGNTGLEVDDWVDYAIEGVTYSIKEGTNYYATNTDITIKFNTNLNGIALNNIKFNAGKKFIYNNVQLGFETEQSVANQYMTLVYQYDNFSNKLIGEFKFKLSVDLLSELSENDENFIVKFAFSVKSYTIIFKGTGYQTGFGVQYTSVDQKGSGKSAIDADILENKKAYGTRIIFTANSDTSTNNFNDKYKVSYIKLSCDDVTITIKDYSSRENPTSVSFDTSQKLTLKNANGETSELAFWEYVANTDGTITIQVGYEAKISLSNFEFIEAEKKWVKNVQYNGFAQDINEDVVYDKSYFNSLAKITYNGVLSSSSIPKNVGVYKIVIEINGYYFKDDVELVIYKAPLTLKYAGGNISKIYDGSTNLTEDNKASLINALRIDGLLGTDSLRFVTNNVSAIYSALVVGTGYDVSMFNLSISGEALANYEFDKDISEMLISGIGVINKKAINITITDYFEFDNMVYKEGTEYTLVNKKSDANITSTTLEEDYNKIFPIGRIQTQGKNTVDTADDVYDDVYIDKTLLKYVLEDYSIGYNKRIHINLVEALAGADKSNYEILDKYFTINIYPYEIVCEVESKGIFKIVDLDEKCIIPIEISPEKGLKVTITESTSADYKDLFSIIERLVGRDERVYGFLEFSLVTKSSNSVSTSSLAGTYMIFEPFKDVSNVYMISSNEATKIKYDSANNSIYFKIDSTQTDLIAVVLNRTYFPIWLIILIVVLILLFIILIIILFIIFKRKRKQKYAENDKIR